jgi:hypothetical protein
MKSARPVQIMTRENRFGFTPESGMVPCCLDPADVLAPHGAAPMELLQNKALHAKTTPMQPQRPSGSLAAEDNDASLSA